MSKFEIYPDKAGYYRWRLKASNGEIVAASEAYATRQNARHSAEKVRLWASGGTVVDLW